jgi:hypothetical protein
MKKSLLALSCLLIVLVSACKQKEEKTVLKTKKVVVRQIPHTITYQLADAKEWLAANKADSTKLNIAFAVNRTDKTNFAEMDSVVIPKDMSGDIAAYLPFPLEVPYLKEVNKIILFSYPTQTFATYENGELIYTGPTNMGRKKDPTPTGLFYTNWKAEQTTSTFNDEWDLRWNFNIANKMGVGWHQYSLPGYPASHSCLRLQEKDARYLYEWADQWVLSDADSVEVKGTPVLIFGSYDFDAPKPWLQLVRSSHALDISKNEIEKQMAPYLNAVLAQQKIRQNSVK